jgi:hypothetical protein
MSIVAVILWTYKRWVKHPSMLSIFVLVANRSPLPSQHFHFTPYITKHSRKPSHNGSNILHLRSRCHRHFRGICRCRSYSQQVCYAMVILTRSIQMSTMTSTSAAIATKTTTLTLAKTSSKTSSPAATTSTPTSTITPTKNNDIEARTWRSRGYC